MRSRERASLSRETWTITVSFEQRAGAVRATSRVEDGTLSGLTGVGESSSATDQPAWLARETATVRSLEQLVRELRGIAGDDDGEHAYADQS